MIDVSMASAMSRGRVLSPLPSRLSPSIRNVAKFLVHIFGKRSQYVRHRHSGYFVFVAQFPDCRRLWSFPSLKKAAERWVFTFQPVIVIITVEQTFFVLRSVDG